MEPGPGEYPTSDLLGAPAADQFADTEATLSEVLGGSETAFARLWVRFMPGLQILLGGEIRKSLSPPLRFRLEAEADDLLQQALHKAYRNIRAFEYRGNGSLMAWLAEILRNEVKNRAAFWRAEKRNPGREQRPAGRETTTANVDPGMVASEPGPATKLDMVEKRRKVALALADLDPRLHQILFLRFFGGAAWKEIAEQIGGESADAVRMECAGKALPALAVALAQVG